jgi:PAS domain S-box-containing protein
MALLGFLTATSRFMLLALLVSGASLSLAADGQKRVLFINSYHRGYQWSDEEERGVVEQFQQGGRKVDLSVEYLDSRRFPLGTVDASLVAALEAKYSGFHQDLILVADNFAFEFAVRNRARLFPGVPLVFCGYNFFRPQVIAGLPEVTGVNEEVDLTRTVDLAMRVQPELRTLVFILSTSDATNLQLTEMGETLQFPELRKHHDLVVIKDASMAEIKDRLGALPPRSAVFLVGQSSDRGAGRALTPPENARMIAAVSPVPVYSYWDFDLGTGVLGGHLVFGAEQGRTAAKLALRILGGTPAASLPVLMKTPGRAVFDFQVMQRFGLKLGALPAGSQVINRPDSLWDRYRAALLGMLGVVAVMGLAIASLALNIQRRKKTEKALRENRSLLQAIIDGSGDPITVKDGQGRYLLLNAAAEALVGRPAAMVLGQDDTFLLPPTEAAAARAMDQGVMASKTLVTFEEQRVDAAGCEANFLTSKGPVRDEAGVVWGVFSIARNLTKRKAAERESARLQAQLQQTQKLESLGSLAGGVAHDMNNVLGAILGLASANLEDQAPGTRVHHALATIIKAAERGGKMVKGLLNFARQSPAEERELALNDLLREQVSLLERTTLAQVTLDLDLDEGLQPMRGDAGALAHAVMNLCVNAVDAMPGGGTLTLRTRNEPGGTVLLAVEDTGTGMPAEVLARALDPFYTTKGLGKGTGLGLAMVFSAVRAHQGDLELQSEPGRGTRVLLRFPAYRGGMEAVHSPVSEDSSIARGALAVLVVDDDDLIRSALVQLLEVLDHRSLAVANGEEALVEVLNGYRPDVVILDMNMPGLGGAGTLPRLRELLPGVPVVLATGRVDQSVLDFAAGQPGVSLLTKPFHLEKLRRHLADLATP